MKCVRLQNISDGTSNEGYGARVDDVYIYYGDTVGSYECGIIADPATGESPLNVAFRATTDMYSPSVYWRFGDGSSSEERDPSHLFAEAGNYRVWLRTGDGYGTYRDTHSLFREGFKGIR